MYTPHYFRPVKEEEVTHFLGKGRFGTLVTVNQGTPVVSHIPFEVLRNEQGLLRLEGHLSAANPQARLLNGTALAIFLGPDSYVSSAWYNHVNVPTWNYIAVHVTGELMELKGSALREMMSRQLAHHEHGSPNPVTMETMPTDYLEDHLKGIRAFSMHCEKIEAAFKMSQNRNDEDYHNIIRQLEKTDDPNDAAVASFMRHNRTSEKGDSGNA